ncbi:uncharacterized protein BCR38DRAFT_421050 [Pseudomassariella vexata]|uniref:Extracellular membrane protein CFEM domain-containing protein n=1 Tax=Pseudomassariella vexata TaxID=1141098 RepID=A0A1Y2EEX3_9PEZI|nr:uncharacterized protein BCR38DRAFT_421050 [Pseudomassariella vexata]ORY70121.1 hypothetical protein BCR38DRAFT_421050 [Pseudomassariella vexata]
MKTRLPLPMWLSILVPLQETMACFAERYIRITKCAIKYILKVKCFDDSECACASFRNLLDMEFQNNEECGLSRPLAVKLWSNTYSVARFIHVQKPSACPPDTSSRVIDGSSTGRCKNIFASSLSSGVAVHQSPFAPLRAFVRSVPNMYRGR